MHDQDVVDQVRDQGGDPQRGGQPVALGPALAVLDPDPDRASPQRAEDRRKAGYRSATVDRGSRAAALSVGRRVMLGERQVAASLVAERAAHRARRAAHRRFEPGEGAGVQLAGLRPGGKPHRPAQRQFGHETLVLAFALIAPAASRPGQHRAVRRQRRRQVGPCGHPSTVGQRFPRLVPRDDERSMAAPSNRSNRTNTRRQPSPPSSLGSQTACGPGQRPGPQGPRLGHWAACGSAGADRRVVYDERGLQRGVLGAGTSSCFLLAVLAAPLPSW
jgi:hypothetical protein